MSRERHPLAGSPVELTDGPHKGKYFIVIDWLQNQYHGKAMENIHKVYPHQTGEVVSRKGLDDKIVWGKLYPLQTLIAVHDDDMKVVSKEKVELQLIAGGKDDTGKSSEENSGTVGSTGNEGCGVSSGTSDQEGSGGDQTPTETARPAGSKDSGPKSRNRRTTRNNH